MADGDLLLNHFFGQRELNSSAGRRIGGRLSEIFPQHRRGPPHPTRTLLQMGPGIRNWVPPGGLALVEPGHSLSRQQEKRRRGGSFSPCSPAAPASSPPYAAMGGEPPPFSCVVLQLKPSRQ